MKILLVGPVSPPISGPSVKNKMMIDWISYHSNDINLSVINTYDFREFKFFKIYINLKKFFSNKYIFLSVSKNGRFLIIPFCWLFRKKVFLFPAGGSFDDEINNLPSIFKYWFILFCRCIRGVFPQTQSLTDGLKALKFNYVNCFPNPRINKKLSASIYVGNTPFKIIFLSKIREGKGPLLLIDSIKSIVDKYPDIQIELNFYGLIDDNFKSKFLDSVNSSKNVNYKGVALPSEVQKVISEHHLFVLPSLFPEGIPGAVIEAMLTGIPIIISSFRASNELIRNGVDGFIVPQGDYEALSLSIEKLILDHNLRSSFSKAVKESSLRYDMDILMNNLIIDVNRIINEK